jgi:hypothetical protein
MTDSNRMSNGILQTSHCIAHSVLQAVDGEVGRCEALYFDDVKWVVRYLLVDGGSWLSGRPVLISPVAVGEVRAREQEILVELTCMQVEHSPPFDPGRPLSRQYEVEYFNYYRWPAYWRSEPVSFRRGSPPGTRMKSRPGGASHPTPQKTGALHTSDELIGCSFVARDAAIGAVSDIVVDTRYWIIRYLLIYRGTRRNEGLLPVSPDWIAWTNWQDRVMQVDLAGAAMISAPTVKSEGDINRDFEARLHSHYGRQGYWRFRNEENRYRSD